MRYVVILCSAAMLAVAPTAGADPDPPNVPAHRHYILTPSGDRIPVGPDVCADPSLQGAFNQFHNNVHRGAPGLHNGEGAEIVALGGCG